MISFFMYFVEYVREVCHTKHVRYYINIANDKLILKADMGDYY